MCGFVGMGWGRGLKATTKLELGCVMEAGSTAFIQKYQVKNLPGFGTQLASYYEPPPPPSTRRGGVCGSLGDCHRLREGVVGLRFLGVCVTL